MKRVARFACLALCFAPSLARGFPFYNLPPILTHLPATYADAERVNRAAPRLSHLDFVLSTFDKTIISQFRFAWKRAGGGGLPYESVVLILKMSDGSYSAYLPRPTNEYKSFTFDWRPETIAIVHTHPNACPPRPEGDDMAVADKYRVPIFTLTSQGMFVYDPATQKVTKVLDGMFWEDDAAWEAIRARLAGR
jgi:hypothetical protein